MAKDNSEPARAVPPKLSRLPKNQKIQKRPLLHPAIPSPRTNSASPKVVYVSTSTSFIATIKRVRALLSHVESRASGPIDFSSGPQRAMKQIEAGISKRRKDEKDGKVEEEVVMKGTGKAIEKVLRMAVYWQGQHDVKVVVRTGSVGAIDDVVGEDGEGDGPSRIRRTSCLEVAVRLR